VGISFVPSLLSIGGNQRGKQVETLAYSSLVFYSFAVCCHCPRQRGCSDSAPSSECSIIAKVQGTHPPTSSATQESLTMSQNDSELQRLRAENQQLKARLGLSAPANEPNFIPSSSDFQLCTAPASHRDRHGSITRSSGSAIIVPTRHRQPVSHGSSIC
jgi:hypothetical protein